MAQADPQIVSTASTVMMEDFERGISEAFNAESVLLNRMKRGKGKMVGEYHIFDVRTRNNLSGAPRAETGTGVTTDPTLPVASRSNIVQAQLTPKQWWWKFGLSGTALSKTKGDKAAIIDLVYDEMESLKSAASSDVNIDLWGTGTGVLATSTNTTNTATITVDSTKYLQDEMQIVFATSTGTVAVERTISSIDSATQFTVNSAVDFSGTYINSLYVYRNGVHNTNVSSSYNNSLPGIPLIVSASGTYANIARSGNTYWQAEVLSGAAGLSLDLMQQAVNRARINAGGKISVIVTSELHWRQYGSLLTGDARWVNSVKRLDGGFEYLDFRTIPIVWDKDCPNGYMYFLDESTFKIIEEEPFKFHKSGGDVLFWLGYGDSGVDRYEGAASWRFTVQCNNPRRSIVINSLPTA